ncbi:MAG: CDP-diacylglycerol--glycerol-3-phosphate 3-phosphatidyltransferase [Ignavibacteriales bacterium]|nr:CDP-diacylglycerol--glycerol-3-phosphate 3-phosphatidyltransferase [Ignavibacteriales bacterium]
MVLPNQLTVLRIILTPVFIFFFLGDSEFSRHLSIIIFLTAAITDWYDGWLARKFNYITNWGKFMDPLADKILTAGTFLSLVSVGLIELWMVLIIVVRDFAITILRGLADKRGLNFTTSRYAKWKTFIQMIVLYYLLFAYVLYHTEYFQINYKEILLLLLNEYLVYYMMFFITLITLHSGVMYFLRNKKLIQKLIKNEN